MGERSERLDRAVSHAYGLSRSVSQRVIKRGQVSVDGQVISDPAFKVKGSSSLSLDGDEVGVTEAFTARVYMLNKPEGYVSADKDRDLPTVKGFFSQEVKSEDLHCVGRLDADTTGLLLVTDDGDLNHRLTSPKSGVIKVYEALTRDPIDSSYVKAFASGLKHPDEHTHYRPAFLSVTGEKSALVYVTEGRFHEVKRLFECVENEVTQLRRVAIGALRLDDNLDEGEYRLLYDDEIELLFKKPEGYTDPAQNN